MRPNETNEPGGGLKGAVGLLLAAAAVVAFPVVLCTTRLGTWGSRYLGVFALAGFVWPLVLAACFGPRQPTDSLVAFWAGSIGLLIAHRVQAARRAGRGELCHSRYWGRGWFEQEGDIDGQRAARAKVSLLAVAAGAAVSAVDPPLGALMVTGGIGKLVSEEATFQASAARVRQMDDARLEAEFLHARQQQRGGGWR